MEKLLSEKEISAKVRELAEEICSVSGEKLTIVCALKGAAVFAGDLIREIAKADGPQVSLEFIVAKSYVGTRSTGKVAVECRLDLTGKDVLLVEDIVDTGATVKEVKRLMLEQGARRVRICTLLDKHACRKHDVELDFVGFQVEDRFLVGYGMDVDERYRELPFVAAID